MNESMPPVVFRGMDDTWEIIEIPVSEGVLVTSRRDVRVAVESGRYGGR